MGIRRAGIEDDLPTLIRIAQPEYAVRQLELLNFEEAVGRLGALMPREAVALGLMARWVASTRDGDLGGDFPAWLAGLFGAGLTLGLADRRG